ncbi:MAG: hypothetical protein KKF48_03460 [Nanoarchaeota archaeon]|nr:hypothetical protein [Nanoarchaeota archaeon]MBU1028077.1 hypothetical protein [Nanoarchaeota archaeon]
MKKGVVIEIVAGIVILAIAGYFYFSGEKEVFCPDYDGNQDECLLHLECEWDSQENNCDMLEGIGEGDNEDEGDVDDGNGVDEDKNWLVSELEEIVIPDNPSNQLCKKIPLSGRPPYDQRYYCLAIINNDAKFCESADTENEKNLCLAHANEDSSYCKKIEGQDATHIGDDTKHVCYFMLAVSSENVNFCDDIDYLDTAQENKEEREQCYFSFMSNLYQWGKSDEITTDMCGHLDSADENTCLALKARDISMCGDNPNCLTFFEQPLSFCDDFPNKVSCIKDRAKYSKNISICESLSQPDRDVCVGVYCTHIELDANVCDKIEDVKKRQEFYVELARTLKNW